VGDELHVARVVLERVEGGAARRVQRERGQELPAGLELYAAGESLAPFVDTLRHRPVDPRLQRAERLTGTRVVGRDRQHDLPFLGGTPELAVALERLGLLAVASRERIARDRGGPRPGLPRAGQRRAAAEREAERHRRDQAASGRPHRRFSSWKTFRFLTKSSSVISE
jgi:hypothetical protein